MKTEQLVLVIILAVVVLALVGGFTGYSMMGPGMMGSYGGFGFGFMWIFPILFLVVLVLVIVWLVQQIQKGNRK